MEEANRNNITFGETRTYAPIQRRPLLFPFQAGIAGYRKIENGQRLRYCVVSGEPFEGKKDE